jgi:hypothetical protein
MAPCREITGSLAKRPDFAILPKNAILRGILEQFEPFAEPVMLPPGCAKSATNLS